jgi:hypothetical protein
MTSNTTAAPFEAFASSEYYAGGYEAYKAFRHSYARGWSSNMNGGGTQYIAIKLDKPRRAIGVKLYAYYYPPTTIDVRGSNDGVNFDTVLDTQNIGDALYYSDYSIPIEYDFSTNTQNYLLYYLYCYSSGNFIEIYNCEYSF